MLAPSVHQIPLQGPDLVLPDGFVLPPWPYFVALVILLVGVVAILWALNPKVTDWTPLAIAPWVLTGGILHALFQIGAFEGAVLPVAPLFNSPAVYATTAIAAGVVWIGATIKAAMSGGNADRPLGVVGTAVAVTIAIIGVYQAFIADVLSPFWPTITVFGAGVVTAVVWVVVSLVFTETAAYTRKTGALVVFGHALDGLTTAVGFDILGVAERTPLSRAVLHAGEQLPTAEYIGAGWLFLLVKLLLAVGIVVLFREWVKDAPQQARIVLLFVAAVGLGPGIHNAYLFAVAAL